MAAQVTRGDHLTHATDVIDNSGAVTELPDKVAALHAAFLDLAAKARQDKPVPPVPAHEGLASAAIVGRESTKPAPPTGSSVIVYEYPLTERIRTMLRLEDLFERTQHFLKMSDPLEHHVVLLTLFEIMEVASRADLKSDLLQELERQKQVLLSFRDNPAVEQQTLAEVTVAVERALAALLSMTGKIGQHLRENEWLMAIKQRTGIPGGRVRI